MTHSRQYYSLLTSSSMMMAAMIAIDWGTISSKSTEAFIISGNNNHNSNNNKYLTSTYQNCRHQYHTSIAPFSTQIKSLSSTIRSPQSSLSSSPSSTLLLATNTNNEFYNVDQNHDDDDDNSILNNNNNPIKKNNVETSRREVFEKAAGIALAFTILDTTTMTNNVQAASAAIATSTTTDNNNNNDMISTATNPSSKATTTPRIIVMTGANSGIGYEACKRIMKQQQDDGTQTTIVLACRTYEKAKDTMERLIKENNNNNNNIQLIPAECNLASLQSIQQFAKTYFTTKTTEDTSYPSHIDVLSLNAGIARNINSDECLRTDDGYELTIGTNHFGHFYLTSLLLPFLQKDNSNQKKIVITASSVHDPDSPGGSQGEKATLGTLNGLIKDGINCEMIDGNTFNADKAYKDSKLCNVLFTRELQRRLNNAAANSKDNNRINVNCFTPGLIVSTGLFRDQNPIFTKLFDIAATSIFKVGETPEFGGTALSYMINDVITDGLFYGCPPGTSSKYNTDQTFYQESPIFKPTDVSIEAQDNDKAKLLWELSEKLLNIKMTI